MNRRDVLRAAGVSILLPVAGCSDDGNGETNGPDDAGTDPNSEESTTLAEQSDGSGNAVTSESGQSTETSGNTNTDSEEDFGTASAPASWPTFQGDTANTGTGTGTASGPVESPSVEWTVTADDEMQGDPIIVDGTVYATSWDDHVYAVSLSSGTEQWRTETGGATAPMAATPNSVIVASSAGVVALDPASGEPNWTASVDVFNDGGPVVADGQVYVPTKEGLVALSASDGEQLWTVRAGDSVASTPHVTNDAVYFASHDANVYAASTDGERLWQNRINDDGGVPSPTVVDGTVYLGWGDGTMYALSTEDGSKQWTDSTGGAETVAVTEGVAYLASYPFKAIDIDTQETVWTTEEPEGLPTNFTVGTDRLYLGSDAKVFGHDRETGEQLWSYQGNYEVTTSVAIANDRLVFGDEFGNLVCLS